MGATRLLLLTALPQAAAVRLTHSSVVTASFHSWSSPTCAASRCGTPFAVSERHNQAYKETIKLFEPIPPDAPMNFVPLESHVPSANDGIANDLLVHTTATPLLTPLECEYIVGESEEWAARQGGWTSNRHFNHPTTDIPLAELPLTRELLNTDVLPTRIYPMLGQAFANSLPNWRALRVADAFIVK